MFLYKMVRMGNWTRCVATSLSHSSLSSVDRCDANNLQLCLECANMNIVSPLIQIFSCVLWGLCCGWPLHEEGNVRAVLISNAAQQSWTVEWTRQVWSWKVIHSCAQVRMYTSSVNTEHQIFYTVHASTIWWSAPHTLLMAVFAGQELTNSVVI